MAGLSTASETLYVYRYLRPKCIGQGALKLYNDLPFASEEDKQNLDVVL